MITFDEATVEVYTNDGDLTILQPTSLSLSEARVALIGANGSGKSTLARLCNGLVVPTSGSVTVHGADGSALDTARDGSRVRKRVGFVFTDPIAQLVMPTVIEDIALSLRRAHRNKQDRLHAARLKLEEFGLADRADQSVHSLSGGQQQLLAIASVLAAGPDIIVADEPTTLLDLTNSTKISQLLMGLPQQVIVATHDLELAAKCDRALVIDNGSVVFDGDAVEAVARYRAGA